MPEFTEESRVLRRWNLERRLIAFAKAERQADSEARRIARVILGRMKQPEISDEAVTAASEAWIAAGQSLERSIRTALNAAAPILLRDADARIAELEEAAALARIAAAEADDSVKALTKERTQLRAELEIYRNPSEAEIEAAAKRHYKNVESACVDAGWPTPDFIRGPWVSMVDSAKEYHRSQARAVLARPEKPGGAVFAMSHQGEREPTSDPGSSASPGPNPTRAKKCTG